MLTGKLTEVLRAADASLRRRDPVNARSVLEGFARQWPSGARAPLFHLMLGEACFQSGDAAAARQATVAALTLQPDWFEALHLLGLALADLELLADAAKSLERAVALRPWHPRAVANLAAVNRRLGFLDRAVNLYRRSTEIDGAGAIAWRGLAESLQVQGIHDESLTAWHRWASLVPDRAEGLLGLGQAYTHARRWNDAEHYLNDAVAEPNADHRADVLLGFVRRERGDAVGATAAYRRGAARSPQALTPAVASSLLLPPVYASLEDIAEWRRRFTAGLSHLEEQLPKFLEHPECVWDLDWTNFYLAYQGEDDRGLQSRYADFVGTLTAAANPDWTIAPEIESTPNRRLRVGFASSYFRRCTIGAYFGSWLTGLDPDLFEVHAFHFGNEVDDITGSMQRSVASFRHVTGDVRRIAQEIRDARLDILIYPQLGMDGRDVTLSTLRLARIQCAGWGHPVTSGSSAIDYYFSCEAMEPVDAPDHYREQLLLLPGLGTAYRCPDVRAASRSEFGLPEDAVLYVCPQSLFKIHPDNDQLFCEVLKRDYRAVVIFCAESGQPVTVEFERRLNRALLTDGLETTRVLHQPLRNEADFRAMLGVCDVLVDTLHWSGGNTSLDALAAGLPIVTCPGRHLRGRQSAAMLQLLGLPELIADDTSQIPALAVWAAKESQKIRSEISRNRHRLFDRPEPLRALELHLLAIARNS